MSRSRLTGRFANALGRAVRQGARGLLHGRSGPGSTARPSAGNRTETAPPLPGGYPGDFRGPFDVAYEPAHDGDPDPGEIVWTWVPFEEDHSRGKDRPVLVVGRDGGWLLALMLTSQDHDRDAADERRYGREWVDIGTGAWDRQGRPSEVRIDRVVRVDPDHVRREGAVLDRSHFERVAAALRASR